MRMAQPAISPPYPPLVPAQPFAAATGTRRVCSVNTSMAPDARRWCTLAVASLVIAGLLSLAVVLGRLPGLSRLIDDPLFFKRCLVVHVDLALVVWFYAFLAALLARGAPLRWSWPGALTAGAATLGVGGMLAGGLIRGAQPVLANYVPVIDHPLFLAGLGLFFAAIVGYFVFTLVARVTTAAPTVAAVAPVLPEASVTGLCAAAAAVILAAVTWLAAASGLPGGLETWTRYEFSAWGAGHVLQVANTCAMLAVWLWLLERATGRTVLSARAARWWFAVLLAPHLAMPLLTFRGSLNSLYHDGATQLMRWGIFPVVLGLLGIGLRHLWRDRALQATAGAGPDVVTGPDRDLRRALLTGFAGSAGLTLLGVVLGACIRGSTTLVPAHYHAALGAVTAAFMTAAYLLAADFAGGVRPALWRAARRQLRLFGAGQAVFALGFALGGVFGLGRKAYAAEQHLRSTGEYAGLIVMAAGGLVAVAGGLWFLFLILREIRGWWRPVAGATRRAPHFAFTP